VSLREKGGAHVANREETKKTSRQRKEGRANLARNPEGRSSKEQLYLKKTPERGRGHTVFDPPSDLGERALVREATQAT